MPNTERLKSIIAKHAGEPVDEIHAETDFTALPRMDSLSHVEVIMEVEEQFGISIDDEEAERTRTLLDMNRLVTKKLASKA